MDDQESLLRRSIPGDGTNRKLFPIVLIFILLITACSGCTDVKRWLYEGFGRDEWQHPEEVVLALHLKAGDAVADLGAGSGYFTFRLADAVGPTGKVHAVDIDPDMTEYVTRRARELNYHNIEVVAAKPDDPLLPKSGVDVIFTCITYHHLHDRPAYLFRLRQYLRPHGRLAIIDFNGEGWFTRLIGHWTQREVILQELQQAGYSLQQELTFLPNQVFLVFSPR